LCISTRVKNIADSTISVTENGAIALKRSDGKGLADDIHKTGLCCCYACALKAGYFT